MARPWRHPKTGVFYLRKRVPLDLVAVVGRAIEKRSLGTKDGGDARRLHAEALLGLEAKWSNLRKGLFKPNAREMASIAGEIYRSVIAETEAGRWSPFAHPFLIQLAVDRIDKFSDPQTIENFRAVLGERIDTQLGRLGIRLDPAFVPVFEVAVARAFRDAQAKSAAMALEGDFSPDPAAARYPPIAETFTSGVSHAEPKGDALAIAERFDAYARAAGLAASTRKRWGLALGHLRKHLGHDDLRRLKTADVADWIAALRVGGRSERTIRDVHLSALKALLSWLVGERKLTENVASGFRIKVPKAPKLRDRDLTDDEAARVLAATLESPSAKLGPKHAAARRWIPWLGAYTGARVNELTQLRHEDVCEENGIAFLRITPEAGTVKTGEFRDVPIHSHLIEQGFLAFARAKKTSPMFYDPRPDGEGSSVTPPYKKLGERLGRWVRSSGAVTDPRVDPFHGWRHRFKTVGESADIPEKVLDALQGHAPKSEGRRYGKVALDVRQRAVERIPRYEVAMSAKQVGAHLYRPKRLRRRGATDQAVST